MSHSVLRMEHLQSKSIEKPLIRGIDSSKLTFRLSSTSVSIDTGAGASDMGTSTTAVGSNEVAGRGQGTEKMGAKVVAAATAADTTVVDSEDDEGSIWLSLMCPRLM